MGNFYANHVLPTANADDVAAVLESHGRRAYIAGVAEATFVYDEQCDAQDLDELRRFAELLSRECRVPVLAACNHDDDVLWLALAEQGRTVDVYDSQPGYFEGEQAPPRVANVKRLCLAFGVTGAANAIEALLEQPHSDFVVEVERHRALLRALGVDSAAGLLGYGYVAGGELAGVDAEVRLRETGGVAETKPGSHGVPAATSSRGGNEPFDVLEGLGSAESAKRIQRTSAALALSEIDLPDGFEEIFQAKRLNGFAAFNRFQRYMMKHGVAHASAPGGPVVRFDALAARLLGVQESPLREVLPLFMSRLGVWEALSAADRTAIESDAPDVHARMVAALMGQISEFSE